MLKRLDIDLQMLINFLRIKTPDNWLAYAAKSLPQLLVDHAHCERKAAATAINFISKYPEKSELIAIMSPLAREELLHFEKVIAIMRQRNINFGPQNASDYATRLHKRVNAKHPMQRLCDQLIIGAIIEARSCERFNALIPYLEDHELAKFYSSLVKSEARHFEDYLYLARLYGGDIDQRITEFLSIENSFITSSSAIFSFHSGIPQETALKQEEVVQL